MFDADLLSMTEGSWLFCLAECDLLRLDRLKILPFSCDYGTGKEPVKRGLV